jgi:hypothetical protein
VNEVAENVSPTDVKGAFIPIRGMTSRFP